MLSRFRRLPSPGLVVACIALAVALAGTAIALPGRNSVDKNDIRQGAVRSKQIKNDTVGGRDVREGSLAQVPSAANADALGGKAADQLLRWVHVAFASGNPFIVKSSHPGFTVEDPNGNTEGLSRVIAPDAVNQCATMVSGGLNSVQLGPGLLTADAGQYATATYDIEPNTILVTTENDTGAAQNRGYFLAILC